MICAPNGKEITKIPHEDDWTRWCEALDHDDYTAVYDAIDEYVQGFVDDPLKTKCLKTAWIMGNDWRETVYNALYEATGQSEEQAGLFAGLFLFCVLMEREERWMFTHDEDDGAMMYCLWEEAT